MNRMKINVLKIVILMERFGYWKLWVEKWLFQGEGILIEKKSQCRSNKKAGLSSSSKNENVFNCVNKELIFQNA